MSEFRKLTFSFLLLFSVSIFLLDDTFIHHLVELRCQKKENREVKIWKMNPRLFRISNDHWNITNYFANQTSLKETLFVFAFEPVFVGPWRHSKNDHLIYKLAQGNFLFILSLTRLSFFALRENQPRCFPDCLSTFFRNYTQAIPSHSSFLPSFLFWRQNNNIPSKFPQPFHMKGEPKSCVLINAHIIQFFYTFVSFFFSFEEFLAEPFKWRSLLLSLAMQYCLRSPSPLLYSLCTWNTPHRF